MRAPAAVGASSPESSIIRPASSHAPVRLALFSAITSRPTRPSQNARVGDLLVRLYDLPARRAVDGVDVRRALPPEKQTVVAWVGRTFSSRWASECDIAFAHQPVGCHIAVRDGALVGFACWDATARGFFGPMGTLERERGRGIGRALLLECLHAMASHGYGYAVIGWVGPTAFYERVVPVIEIPGSSPGIYRGLVPEDR